MVALHSLNQSLHKDSFCAILSKESPLSNQKLWQSKAFMAAKYQFCRCWVALTLFNTGWGIYLIPRLFSHSHCQCTKWTGFSWLCSFEYLKHLGDRPYMISDDFQSFLTPPPPLIRCFISDPLDIKSDLAEPPLPPCHLISYMDDPLHIWSMWSY